MLCREAALPGGHFTDGRGLCWEVGLPVVILLEGWSHCFAESLLYLQVILVRVGTLLCRYLFLEVLNRRVPSYVVISLC